MQLENNFTIDAPVEKAWEALNSPETVAPCFPGATLTNYEGDAFAGTVKVKLGPIAMTYKGKGTYISRDEDAHEVVIDATGRDSRGNGTASAKVTATLAADGPDRTAVSLVTDMTITGKPAQFGRGVIADVADKIIGQFSACVARKLAAGEEPAAAAAPAAAVGRATDTPPPATPPTAASAPARGHGGATGVAAATSNGVAPSVGDAAGSPVSGEAEVAAAVDQGVATGPATGTAAGTPAPSGTAAPVPAPLAAPAAASTGTSSGPASADAAAATPASGAPPRRATPQAPLRSEVDAIDLLDTAGAPVIKRVAPAAAATLLLLLVILLVRRLRSR